jgi:hypothetical protein
MRRNPSSDSALELVVLHSAANPDGARMTLPTHRWWCLQWSALAYDGIKGNCPKLSGLQKPP